MIKFFFFLIVSVLGCTITSVQAQSSDIDYRNLLKKDNYDFLTLEVTEPRGDCPFSREEVRSEIELSFLELNILPLTYSPGDLKTISLDVSVMCLRTSKGYTLSYEVMFVKWFNDVSSVILNHPRYTELLTSPKDTSMDFFLRDISISVEKSLMTYIKKNLKQSR